MFNSVSKLRYNALKATFSKLNINTVCKVSFVFRLFNMSLTFDSDELYDSVCKWRELFGNEFPPAPKPSKSNSSTGFTTRTEKSAAIPEGRFA